MDRRASWRGRPQPHAAPRAELAEEIRESSAREPGAQQAPEQRGRDREQRGVEDPDERDHRGVQEQRREPGGVQEAAKAARRGSAAALAGAAREAERQRAPITNATPSDATIRTTSGRS